MSKAGKKKTKNAAEVAGTAGQEAIAKEKKAEEDEIERLKKEIELETKNKENATVNNAELERSVRAMEKNVMQLESGNLEADDSEIKQKFDNQRQLNVQLQEQKRWLEHELEQIKLKIQNEKLNPLPDPFALDWDNLSETEMKRLVGQLEKTKADLISDLHEMQFRLDKEGREFHHYDDFCQLYRAEILNLNRILDALVRNGVLPSNFIISTGSQSSTANTSITSTGANTPGSMLEKLLGSPKKAGSPRKPGGGSPTKSPEKARNPRFPMNKDQPDKITTKVDPKHGPQRKTAGVRNLPKIDRNAAVAGKAGNRRQQAKAGKAFGMGKVDFESNGTVDEEDNMHSRDNMDPSFDKQAILRELGSAKQSGLPQSELEPVAEEP